MTYEFYPLRGRIRHLFIILLVSVAFGVSTTDAQIVIDHNCTDISKIPDYWIGKAKELLVVHTGQSHGRQVPYGLMDIETDIDSKYDTEVVFGDFPADTGALRVSRSLRRVDGLWRDYADTTDFWDGNTAMDNVRRTLDYHAANGNNVDVILHTWSWDFHTETTFDKIDRYFAALEQLELEYPNTTFIYMTDTSDKIGDYGYNRWRNHQRIRQYVRDNNKVLFDFGELETWSADGTEQNTFYHSSSGLTIPVWHDDWYLTGMGVDGKGYVGPTNEGPCHINKNATTMKGKAFWWMLARLAGWSGISDPNVYTLTVNTHGNGTVIKSPDKVNYELNEVVTLQASPGTGYMFDYWDGDVTGAVNPVTITMDSDKNINAYFRKIDIQPPSIVSLRCYINSLEITFDESLNRESAEKISNYSINNNVSVTSATLSQAPSVITLATSKHSEGMIYTLTVANVEDVSENPMSITTIEYEYDDGLVGYWSFYAGFGLKASDLSGNGNDGIIAGATWFEGRSGKGLQFDGIDDYVDCGNGAALDISGEGAFAAWIKVENPVQSGSMKIISKKNASDAMGGYELEYIPGLHYISVSGSGNNVGSAQNVDLNTSWHHVVAVIKGTTAEIYLDGYNRTTDTTVGALVNSGYALQIGRQSMGAEYFQGVIDEVHIYNRALSEDEISNLFYDVATDLNGDYKVNKFDWAIFAASWSARSGSQGWNYLCDIAPSGGDGVVDYRDLAVLCNGWLKENGGSGQQPYTSHEIHGRIEAEDYDYGGEGVAYHDKDSGNSGGAYRSDGVDIESCSEGGYNVSGINDSEWLEYTVDVLFAGTYNIEVRVASNTSVGNLHIEFDDKDVTGTINFGATGGRQNWISVYANAVRLSAGKQVMRVAMDSSGWNLNWVRFEIDDITAPAAPTGLSATAGDETVSLDWNDNSEGDLAGYNVYRSMTPGGGYSKLNGTLLSSSDYTDNSVSNDTTYYYVVTAVDTASNESGYSNEDSATPTDTTPPAAPTGLVATAGDATVSLDWNNNVEGDLDGYNVYRSTIPGGGYSKLNGELLSSSDYTDNSVSNGTTYYYVVTAVDTSSNESGYSNEASATPIGSLVVFSDSFENGEWNGLWTEDSQMDWMDSTQRAVDGSYSAEVDGSASDSTLTSILIDLQGKTNATVTFFWLIENGLDSGEYLAFDVSTDGGSSWIEKAILRGNVDPENTWHDASIDVTGISGGFQIRFRAKISRSNEDANVDMVEVEAW